MTGSSVFSTVQEFWPDYRLLLELHAFTQTARSYALLMSYMEVNATGIRGLLRADQNDLSPNCEKSMDQKCTATIWHFEPLWSRASEGLDSRWNQGNQMFWGKNRGKWKGWQSLGIEPRTQSLCSQYSAIELRQLDSNHNPLYILPEMHTWQQLSTLLSLLCIPTQCIPTHYVLIKTNIPGKSH